jgi:hypothetical protein
VLDSLATRKKSAAAEAAAALDAFSAKVSGLTGAGSVSGAGGAAASRETFGAMTGTLLPIFNALQASDEVPTAQMLRAADERMRVMASLRTQWTALTTSELAALNTRLTAAGISPLKVVDVTRGPGFGTPPGSPTP